MAFCVEGLIITGEYYLVEIKSLLQMVTRTLYLTVIILAECQYPKHCQEPNKILLLSKQRDFY